MDVAHLEQTMRLVDDASAALIGSAVGLSDAQCRAASRLRGWSRGHLLTHVARNADALRNLLTSARTGAMVPMYSSPQSRDADIEAGAGRPAAALVTDLREAAARLQEAAEALGTGAAWETVVEWRRGRSRPVSDVPRARLTEIALHHMDLDAGLALADLPDAVTDAVIAESLARLAALPDTRPPRVHPVGGQATGGAHDASDQVTVHGTGAALAGWLSGRTDGADLRVDGDLPRLPAWT